MEKRIKSVMSAVFGVDESKINEGSSPDTLVVWDSLRNMDLVVALEEEFGIQFTEEEMLQMLNFRLIARIISEKIQA